MKSERVKFAGGIHAGRQNVKIIKKCAFTDKCPFFNDQLPRKRTAQERDALKKKFCSRGRHDEIIPSEQILDVYNRLPDGPESPQKIILYDSGYHMLLRDLEAEIVMRDIVN